jgi:chromosome segregation ATPase
MMAIPAVVQGTVELDGKVFEFDSPKGLAWLKSVTSFRFEPTGANKPYTVRKESGKGGDYWYGYRKVAGKLHKKYIGKSSEVSTTKLEEIAEALNTPPQPRVTRKVTEVTEANSYGVTDRVTDNHDPDRLTALELQVQALQESLEALREALPGKSEGLSNSPELLKPIAGAKEVADSELQIELGNLKAENENLRQKLELLKQELAENTRYYTVRLSEAGATIGTFKDKLEALQAKKQRLQNDLGNSQVQIAELREQLAAGRAEPEENKKSAPLEKDLPEAADLLNKLKAKRKKSKTDLADLEAILELLQG